MLLEVVVEYDHDCPRSRAVVALLKEITDRLDIPLIIKDLSTHSVAAYEESVALRTLNPEWIQRYGTWEHKRVLRRARGLIEYMYRNRMHGFPVIRIRWHDGLRPREIVIKGFDPSDKEMVRSFARNIYMLLSFLKKTLRG